MKSTKKPTNNASDNVNKGIYEHGERFWSVTYASGVIEYVKSAPFESWGDSSEYKRLQRIGNPVIKFEMVKASKENNDLRIVPVKGEEIHGL
jgi:hypothetical protein